MIKFTEEVYLDTINESDLPIIRAWRNDPAIWKWCRQNDLISEATHRAWFKRQEEDPAIKMWSIKVEDCLTPIGVCGLTSIDRLNRSAEFSLYIGPEHQGKGYGKSALLTLLWHGFMNQGLNSVWGETFRGNKAAEMFKDVGFSCEGYRKEAYFREGRYISADYYGILYSEFYHRYLDRNNDGTISPRKEVFERPFLGLSGKYVITPKRPKRYDSAGEVKA